MKNKKIFGIGLSRTGTKSCYQLMSIFGFSAVHYPSSFEDIDKHIFSNDSPVSARFEKLDSLYPNSFFIYSVRDMEQWIRSCLARFSSKERNEEVISIPDHLKKWYDYGDMNLYGRDLTDMKNITREELTTAYLKHEERVNRYFHDKKSSLLKVDFTNRASAPLSTLTRFLEKHGVIEMIHANKKGYPIETYSEIAMNKNNILTKAVIGK